MARLQQLKLTITTGDEGTRSPVRIRINGHTIPVIRTGGGTGPRERFEGSIQIGSVVHSLELLGPPLGRWEIGGLHAWFLMDQGDPYGNEVGPVMLEANTSINIWSTSDTFSV
jgi:hypothetical protein